MMNVHNQDGYYNDGHNDDNGMTSNNSNSPTAMALFVITRLLQDNDNGDSDDLSTSSPSASRRRTILTIIYLTVLGVCCIVPILFYCQLRCDDRRRNRELYDIEIAGLAFALAESARIAANGGGGGGSGDSGDDDENSADLHGSGDRNRAEARAIRRKYREERRARIIQLFSPVRMILTQDNFVESYDDQQDQKDNEQQHQMMIDPIMMTAEEDHDDPDDPLDTYRLQQSSSADRTEKTDQISNDDDDDGDDGIESDKGGMSLSSCTRSTKDDVIMIGSDEQVKTTPTADIENNIIALRPTMSMDSSDDSTGQVPAIEQQEDDDDDETTSDEGKMITMYVLVPEPGLPSNGSVTNDMYQTTHQEEQDHPTDKTATSDGDGDGANNNGDDAGHSQNKISDNCDPISNNNNNNNTIRQSNINGGGGGNVGGSSLPFRRAPVECSICLSEYEVGSDVVWSSNPRCHHVFHTSCMERWLMKQRDGPLCPCCRRDFIIDPFDVTEREDDDDNNDNNHYESV